MPSVLFERRLRWGKGWLCMMSWMRSMRSVHGYGKKEMGEQRNRRVKAPVPLRQDIRHAECGEVYGAQ